MALNEVSLREKIGQMLIMGFAGTHIDDHSKIVHAIDNDNIGGVILFDYDNDTKQFNKNITDPKQVTLLNSKLQDFTKVANLKHQRPALPLLISVDYEGGMVNRLKTNYGFPETKSAAKVAQLSVDAAKQQAAAMAATLQMSGFNLNFAPMLDVNVNPENPIVGAIERSFSANPKTVALYAEIYAKQFLQHNIQCAYKHFPGHGSSTADSHLGFVDVTDTWQPYELDPYKILFANKKHTCQMVMTAHIINRNLDASGLPATLSHKMLTELLRHELKFTGVIITDDMQMKAISDHYGLDQALVLAINAGADMFIFGNNLGLPAQDSSQLIDIIENKVHSGAIDHALIDASYERILALKQGHIQSTIFKPAT